MTRTHRGSHDYYTAKYRHFSPVSQPYTGADSLIYAERRGWHILRLVYEQRIPLGESRSTLIYYFKLKRDNETMIMAVTHNPYVDRVIRQNRMLVKPYQPRTDRARRRRYAWRSVPYGRRVRQEQAAYVHTTPQR